MSRRLSAFTTDTDRCYRRDVVVLASNESGCRTGATGTLILSVQYLTAPRVAVTVCGRTYLDGKGQVSAQMKTV